MAIKREITIFCDVCEKPFGPFEFANHAAEQAKAHGWKIARNHTCDTCLEAKEQAKEE